MTLTKDHERALKLLARGGVRYGTMICEMIELRDSGLCYAHDNGADKSKGRWTWRPTEAGWKLINKRNAQ